MSFDSLGLSAELLRAVKAQGYDEPTPIQSRVIPVILEGRDVMAGAQTGTGKTAGFTLPLLQRLSAQKPDPTRRRVIRALVLVPTRELAAQVEDSVKTYGKFLPLRTAVIYGGVSMYPQVTRLRDGVDIVVATPGRLLDHAEQRTLDLSRVEILVLDEADRMLDMGFIRDIRKIINMMPRNRQSLMFSATTSAEIQDLARDLMKSPELIQINHNNAPTELVEQIVHPVDRARKRELLSSLIRKGNWRQVLVFTRTKHSANKVALALTQDGLNAAVIHGNKSQGARMQALASFKKGGARVLVATDIAARGLDIDQLPHVVNFELPNVPEDYVHRIGRTGRAGNEGQAVSLVCVDELGFLNSIERMLGRGIERQVIPGFEVDPSIRAEPIVLGRTVYGAQPSRSNDRRAPRRNSGGNAPFPRHSRGGDDRYGARPSRSSRPGRRHPRADSFE